MNLRAASLFFAFAFAALPTEAQSPTVDSLASDLAALAARVAKLEGQIVAADLVGTYALYGFQNELGASGPGRPTQISSYVFMGTLVLAADGTGTLSASAANGNTLTLGAQSSSVQPFQGSDDSSPQTFPWTYGDGAVTVPGGNSPMSFRVAAGGRLLVNVTANHADGTNVLLIFTRLQ